MSVFVNNTPTYYVSTPGVRQVLNTPSQPTVVNINPVIGSGESLNRTVNFHYGDATPTIIAALDGFFVRVSVDVDVEFNGAGAELSIGTLANPGLFMAASENDLTVACSYQNNVGEHYNATPIYLFITPGTGATQGSGTIHLEIDP